MITVGSPAWYNWLEQHTAFTLVDQAGSFTAFKINHPLYGPYWQASSTLEDRLSRFELGPSHSLTLPRLQAVAQALAGQPVAGDSLVVFSEERASAEYLRHNPNAQSGYTRSLEHTKLSPPHLAGDLISRPRLLERLHSALDGHVTLLCAPAGYGKTTVLAQWLQTVKRPVAWLTLDGKDNKLVAFVYGLVTTLQRVVPGACRATASLFRTMQFLSPHDVGLLLVNDLANLPEDIVLVLDDYHLIAHQHDIHLVLDLLIRHLPAQVHLVLATRNEPSLPLAKWRAQGQVADLRGPDLCFTTPETYALLSRVVDDDLAHLAAEVLVSRTEGWIAALSLAVHSLRRSPDRETFLTWLHHFPADWVSRYLLEEILDQQSPTAQQMLLRLSLLTQFCADLGAAVLGGEISAEQLSTFLEQSVGPNVMLIPLDDHKGWYRFHSLLKPSLELRLQERVSPVELVALHRRASIWYAEHDSIDEALLQSLAAGDHSEAAQLVEANFLAACKQEQWIQVERWLSLLPGDLIQSRPGLLIAWAWILQVRGQSESLPGVLTRAEQLLRTCETTPAEPTNPQPRTWHALITLGWCYSNWLAGDAQTSLENARSALEWTPSNETYVVSQALFFLALTNQATGQEEPALIALNKALRFPSAHLGDTARLLLAQGAVYLAAGKLLQAEQTARHLLRLAQDADLALSVSWAHWLLGTVSYEKNYLDEAIYHYSAVIADVHRAPF